MERSYITAAFFRDRLTQRYKEELERERLDGSFRPPANERELKTLQLNPGCYRTVSRNALRGREI